MQQTAKHGKNSYLNLVEINGASWKITISINPVRINRNSVQ